LAWISAPPDATAGQARSEAQHREAAIPAASARAAAVAIGVLVAAMCCVAPARADSTPPPTTPTSTTPDAPPPDPYKAPAPASKPKPVTKPTVVHSAPVYHAPVYHAPVRRTYTPPASTPAVVVRPRVVQPRHTASRPRHVKKAVHRHKARVVHRHVAATPKPKPVKVAFNPFANLVAASGVSAATDDSSDRRRYLRFAGLAFAVLAVAACIPLLVEGRARSRAHEVGAR
jgi:hypothetical protein